MDFDFLLPPPPASWDSSKDVKLHKRLAKVLLKPIEPAGHAFMGRVRRHKANRTLAEDYELNQALLEAQGDNEDEEEDEPESKKLLASDPSKWRDQDHYAVMGLSKKRYLATDDDIKRAYRRKVLKHHPDKKGGHDSFFKCIQKAWEVLTDPKKRRQWDSCDPTFDETIPNPKDAGDFFEIYGPKFHSEARFSKDPVVPSFGGADSSREEVEAFYQFWLNFESWRTFERRDEEDTDKAGSREEKRWLDKKNVAARKKHKKEDIQRVNKFVDQAFNLDPRIKAFKAAEKYAKNAKKREKEAAETEAARLAEEAKIAKEKEEEELKLKQQNQKKDKEAVKNAIKKEKKTVRRLFRDNNSFLTAGADASAVAVQTEKVEAALNSNNLDYLTELRTKFEKALTVGNDAVVKVLANAKPI
ncbi:hypothetical protein HDV01_001507 [Terramyces sp. JEL0728]|nr:hypothetical protein HDV01_001507 [Terramyces sp. JEL0728]